MSRPLANIPDGVAVIVDANILVYALMPQAQFHRDCRALLERGARGLVSLSTSVSVTADVLHRTMVLEVLAEGLVARSADAVALLKRQPTLIPRLTRYRTVLRDLRQARIDMLPLTYRDLHASRQSREQFGLLVNDSLIVAVMQRERITTLATNDPDFARVPGLDVRTPQS